MRAAEHLITRIVGVDRGQILVGVGSGGTSSIFGVAETKALSGHAIAVAIEQEMKIIGGGPISSLDMITSDGEGRAVVAASGDWCIGQAMQSVAVAGEMLRCLLRLPPIRLTY